MKNRKNLYFIICLVIIALFKMCPGVGSVSSDGMTAIGLVVAMVWLIATEAVPTGVMAFMAVVLQPILGLTESLAESAGYWASYLFFFVMMAFVIGVGFQNTNLTQRFLCYLLKKAKNDGRGPILAIFACTSILSGIIPNFAIAALMLSFCWEYIKLFDGRSEQRRVAACTLIGMCAATELGGNLTPLGSSINMLVISTMESYGYELSFLKWISYSVPLFIVLFFIMEKVMFAVFKPAAISDEQLSGYIAMYDTSDRLTARERKLLAIIFALIVLFLLSSWVPALKAELLVCCCGVVLLLPILDIADYEKLAKSEAFTQTTYILTFMGLATILQKTGVVNVIMGAFQAVIPTDPSLWLIVAMLCVVVIFLCNFLPAAAVPSVLGVPMLLLAENYGYHPMLLIPLGMCSNCSWILPLDPIALLTFGRGYYKIQDMVKVGTVLTMFTAVVTAIWSTVFTFVC